MRTYDVTVRTRPNRRYNTHWNKVASYTCDCNLNIRAVVIYLFQHHFGKAPKMHWAESGSLCMGQAWNTRYRLNSRMEVEVHQHNRMTDAYEAAQTVIWYAQQPRLMERRAA